MEEVSMTNEERDIQRKLRVLRHAEKIGNARKACHWKNGLKPSAQKD
jgi:hypothetical protein